MKVLFVSSGNSAQGITSLVKNQGNSLERLNVNISYFAISKKGIKGYLQSIKPLRKHLKQNNYDLIHAHYSFSGIICTLARPGMPVITSLMGSDVNDHWTFKWSARIFARYFWKRTIVKSKDLKKNLAVYKAVIIPNGVDTSLFTAGDKITCQDELGWNKLNKHVLFAADPGRRDKNFLLTEKALGRLNNMEYELHFLDNIPHNKVPVYMNAADVILLSSPFEGSPNVIKEAMACNCPIVSTDVGDVREIIGNTEGCFIVGQNPESFAEGIRKALAFGKRTNGRQRIQHLDSTIIAQKIIALYNEVLER